MSYKRTSLKSNNIRQELMEINNSIEVMREKLNKLVGEGLKADKRTFEISQQLDVLIRDYYLKSIEIDKND
ncbi:aspartyl-phosphate phosphatase Spo0E family protein [Caloramator quimbayensis]|nr:aspartyl-phosphate phosphatase Spo0E family protein [Caloramator quimbayensis]